MLIRDGCNGSRDFAGFNLVRRQHCLGLYAEKLHWEWGRTKVFVVISEFKICRVVSWMLSSQPKEWTVSVITLLPLSFKCTIF